MVVCIANAVVEKRFDTSPMRRDFSKHKAREEGIRLIESAPLPLISKIELLLTFAQQKPCSIKSFNTMFRLPYDFAGFPAGTLCGGQSRETRNPERWIMLPSEYVRKILDIYERLGLAFIMGDTAYRGVITMTMPQVVLPELYVEQFSIYYGKNPQETLDLFNAFGPGKPLDHRTIGKLIGYPETAIDAHQGYLPKASLEQKRMACSKNPALRIFTCFMMSFPYLEEEIKTAQRWHDTVRDLSPRLYREILDRTTPIRES